MALNITRPYQMRLRQLPKRYDCTRWQYLQNQHSIRQQARSRLIREASVYYPVVGARFMDLPALNQINQHFTVERVRIAMDLVNEEAVAGIDGITLDQCRQDLNPEDLVRLVRSRHYRPKPLRRVYIKKPDGTLRPLGIPCAIDRVVQRVWLLVMEQVFERQFLPCSYGYRPGRNCHHALEEMASEISARGIVWILDADFTKYFDSVSHDLLMSVIASYISDPVFLQFCLLTLKADVLVNGKREHVTQGTPQGGVISPLFANIFAHVVLDLFFESVIRPQLSGWVRLFRYADDFVVLTESEADVQLVKSLIIERAEQWGLSLHPTKTVIKNLTCPQLQPLTEGEEPRELTFLGYELSWHQESITEWTLVGRTAPGRRLKALERWRMDLNKLEQELRAGTYDRRRCLHTSARIQKKLNLSILAHVDGFGNYYRVEGNETELSLYEEAGVGQWRPETPPEAAPASAWLQGLRKRRRLRSMGSGSLCPGQRTAAGEGGCGVGGDAAPLGAGLSGL